MPPVFFDALAISLVPPQTAETMYVLLAFAPNSVYPVTVDSTLKLIADETLLTSSS